MSQCFEYKRHFVTQQGMKKKGKQKGKHLYTELTQADMAWLTNYYYYYFTIWNECLIQKIKSKGRER